MDEKTNSDITKAKFTKFLEITLNNRKINYIRDLKNLSDSEKNLELTKNLLAPNYDLNIDADLSLLDLINSEILFKTLNSLSVEEYELLNLRIYHKMSFQEVSLKLGKNYETVRKSYYRAIQKLKEVLEA